MASTSCCSSLVRSRCVGHCLVDRHACNWKWLDICAHSVNMWTFGLWLCLDFRDKFHPLARMESLSCRARPRSQLQDFAYDHGTPDGRQASLERDAFPRRASCIPERCRHHEPTWSFSWLRSGDACCDASS